MDYRSKQLDDRIKSLMAEEQVLHRKISDRDEILSYTLQRLVKMAEVTSESEGLRAYNP